MQQLGDPITFLSPDKKEEHSFAIFSDGVALRLVQASGEYELESGESVGGLRVSNPGKRHEFGDSLSGLESSFRRVKQETEQAVRHYEQGDWRNVGGGRGWSTQYLWEELRIARRQNNVCAGATSTPEPETVSF